MVHHELSSKAQDWFLLAEGLNWESFDPYDILLSPHLRFLQSISPLLARVSTQVGKHSGALIRRLISVQPHEEAKTLSDFLLAAVLFSECHQHWAKQYLSGLPKRLIAKSITTNHGVGWGLEFPYTNRFINVPARTPNIYQTINAIQSFTKLYKITNNQKYLDFALQGCSFIVNDLGTFKRNGMIWFSYWPGSENLIVNVQSTAAATFSFIGILVNEPKYLELADYIMETVINTQRENGSWNYSADGKANFVDGFHTGFILQGLVDYVAQGSVGNYSNAIKAIREGFFYFKQHLVSKSGLPLDIADGHESIDGQNFAQCVQTFAKCNQSSVDIDIGYQLWQKMIKIPSLNRNNFHELRWSYGPAVLATAYLFQIVPK